MLPYASAIAPFVKEREQATSYYLKDIAMFRVETALFDWLCKNIQMPPGWAVSALRSVNPNSYEVEELWLKWRNHEFILSSSNGFFEDIYSDLKPHLQEREKVLKAIADSGIRAFEAQPDSGVCF